MTTRVSTGRRVPRRIAAIGAGLFLAVAAYGCGSSDPSVSSGVHQRVHAGDDGSQVRTVEYEGVAFDVPADWPVHDLAQDPTTCVRFDVHAVYLGTPGPDMQCPAGLVGRTDAVLVQPASSDPAKRTRDEAPGVVAQEVNGLSVAVANESDSQGQVVASTGSVTATISTSGSDVVAQQIVASMRAVGQ